MRTVLPILLVLQSFSVLSSQELETWRSGKFSVAAKLLDANPTQIRLQKQDGQVLTVPLERLSNHSISRLRKDRFFNKMISHQISGKDTDGLLRAYNYRIQSRILGPIAFSRDSRAIFFATTEKIFAIDTETGHILHSETLPKEMGNIEELVVSQDGHFMAAVGKLILAWQIRRNARPILIPVSAFELPRLYRARALAISPDSEHIATTSRYGEIRVVETATGSLAVETDKTMSSVTLCAFENDTTLVLSDGKSRMSMDIESITQKETRRIANGRHLYFNESLTKWSATNSENFQVYGVTSSAVTIGDKESTKGFAQSFLTDDGKSLFALSPQRIAHWDVRKGKLVKNYNILMKTETSPDKMIRLALSPCERYIAGISEDMKRVYIYRLIKL